MKTTISFQLRTGDSKDPKAVGDVNKKAVAWVPTGEHLFLTKQLPHLREMKLYSSQLFEPSPLAQQKPQRYEPSDIQGRVQKVIESFFLFCHSRKPRMDSTQTNENNVYQQESRVLSLYDLFNNVPKKKEVMGKFVSGLQLPDIRPTLLDHRLDNGRVHSSNYTCNCC